MKNKLISFICNVGKLVTEISSKLQKFKTSIETINNLIHRIEWHKVVDEKL